MKASRSPLSPMAPEPPLAFECLCRIFSFFSKVLWASWRASLVGYAVALATLTYCPLANGQVVTQMASAPDQSPLQYVNRLLPKWLRVSGEFRDRVEGRTAFGFRSRRDDAYDLTRFRVNLEISPRKWVTVFVQGQDARALGIDPSRLSPALKDAFDLQQAYVELKTGEKDGVSLRVGRQDLIFGSERLVGALDWGNTARSFDAIRLAFVRGRSRVDVFASSVVVIDMNHFDKHRPGENFYGVYASFANLMPHTTFQPYVLAKTISHMTSERGRLGDADVYTAGMRGVGQLPHGFDYPLEMARQVGHCADDDIQAWAGYWIGGYSVTRAPLNPRFSLEYAYATGDANPGDGRAGTFDQIYPTNHAYYGIADQVGWRNIRNLRSGFELKPHKKVKVSFDYHFFWLASGRDGLYNASGSLVVRAPAGGAQHLDVGREADAYLNFTPATQVSIGAGIGHLFPGRFLKENSPGSGTSYPYFFTNYRF